LEPLEVKPLALLAAITAAAALCAGAGAGPATAAAAATDPIAVVAAENFYGDVARQIGGPQVKVTGILSNPATDPHLFEADPSVARALAAARIVIYNGMDYDPWVAQLLRAAAAGGGGGGRKTVIVAAALVGRKTGDNPHIWYEPQTMPALAQALAAELRRADPAHRADYARRLAQFQRSLQPIDAEIAALRARLADTPVTATEPVLGYLLAALGLQVRNQRFQLAVMNNTEPSASDIAAFEDDLRAHRVRLLVYNSQASDPVAQHMLEIARASHIPILGAAETEPPGTSYQTWIAHELDAVDRALPK
jgi:zinc/manganese transport system substrate-binding protein